jgi:hypothetical protein
MPPTTSADDTFIAAHLASGILAATMRVASVETVARPRRRGDRVKRRQFVTLLGGLHGLKTDSSARADD